MKPLYYHIKDLQNDIKALGAVVDVLRINKLTIAERSNLLNNLQTFLKDLRDDLHVVIEGYLSSDTSNGNRRDIGTLLV